MTAKIAVSLSGKSVHSSDIEDFSLNSDFTGVKIYKQNETYDTVTVPASSFEDVTITHNLGFAPITMLYTELTPGSGNWFFGLPYDISQDTIIYPDYTTYVDNAVFKFRISNNTASEKIVKYRYIIFGNSL